MKETREPRVIPWSEIQALMERDGFVEVKTTWPSRVRFGLKSLGARLLEILGGGASR
jgi:hypothetical protein